MGFDKIAAGDFGRCSVAATVRSEAEDERRSREQSLPLRHAFGQFSTFSFRLLRQRQRGDNARRAAPNNGMDAPALNGITLCQSGSASNHLNQQERPR
jgi:hypothetical protein